MKFIAGKIGSKDKIDIEAKLQNSKETIIATAYFSPRDQTMKSLRKVRNLKLIYSDEYQITDPEKLWQLVSNGAEVRWVPTRDPEGKLHAKIYCGIRKKGGKFAFVSSGNLTDNGLFKNQEAGVLFDSENTEDCETIEKIFVWLSDLWAQHERHIFNETKYAEAKSRYEAAKRWLRKKPREPGENHPWKENSEKYGKDWGNINYYAIMPGKKADGEDFHREFKKYKVVGIGYKDGPGEGGKMVRSLQRLRKGDLILISRGYNTYYNHEVRIFSVARITDDKIRDFKHDKSILNNINSSDSKFKGWLKYWYGAKVLEPREAIHVHSRDLGGWLKKGAMEHAVQQLDGKCFERLAKELLTYRFVIDI